MDAKKACLFMISNNMLAYEHSLDLSDIGVLIKLEKHLQEL